MVIPTELRKSLDKDRLAFLKELAERAETKATNGEKQDSDALYSALHFVGDDPVKFTVESILKSVLDEQHYRLVVAAFEVASGRDEEFNTRENGVWETGVWL